MKTEEVTTIVQGVTLCCWRCNSRKFFVYVKTKDKISANNYICSECGAITFSDDEGIAVEGGEK